jgi:hypothetical protein
MLDTGLKVMRVNNAFLDIFTMEGMPLPGTRIASLHPFWDDGKVKECLRDVLIKSRTLKAFVIEVGIDGRTVKYRLDSKIIIDNTHTEKRLLIVVHKK